MKREHLSQLREQLPALAFVPELDGDFQANPLAQQYLDFYGINFAAEMTGLCHGFGVLDVEDYRLATHYWLPQEARGALFLVHGYYDHVGLYGHVIRFALQSGLAVVAFDLPGHGLSTGALAVIDSFDAYANALERLVQSMGKLLPRPWHLIGQSTGGAVILNHLWRFESQDFEKVMLLAPLIRAHRWAWVNLAHMLLSAFVSQIDRAFAASSHDENFNRFLAERDPLQARIVSVPWVGAMKRWVKDFVSFAPKSTPVLLVQGDADTTVDWRFNIPLIQAKLPVHRLQIIAGARHQLVNESERYRQELFGILSDYLQQPHQR